MEKENNIIQIWLDAEEELRNGNGQKCIDLKHKFSMEFIKLSTKSKKYVVEYMESIAA